ncbi:MAG: hypothetical protein R3E68_05025 [Burkholderiaceae bacterium]
MTSTARNTTEPPTKYFRSSRRPTIAETIAYYREEKDRLVMFTVDAAETSMGRRRTPEPKSPAAANEATAGW